MIYAVNHNCRPGKSQLLNHEGYEEQIREVRVVTKEYGFSQNARGRSCRAESAEDTTSEAARIQFSILRRRGVAGRGEMAIELSDGLRATIESGVRRRHPDYSDSMVRLAALRLAIGQQLFDQAFPVAKETR